MSESIKKKEFNLMKAIISVVLTALAPIIGGIVAQDLIDEVYLSELVQPFFAPPTWVFSVVWAILYVLMAIAFYRAWVSTKTESESKCILGLYTVHIILNAAFTILFFNSGLRLLAFIDCVILVIIVGILIKKFKLLDKVSAYIMIPYWLWLVFASILSFSFWFLNM